MMLPTAVIGESYLIISSARSKKIPGSVSPSAFAVLEQLPNLTVAI